MEKNKIRLLRADEIECRVGAVKESGVSLLLYKDARVDMKILDEAYGPLGWQRRHVAIGESLYCVVSIWDEQKGQWIEKMDVGTESYAEKAKGQASDSFKRACVSLGIGRELYTAPFIWIPRAKADIRMQGDRYVCYGHFTVKEIAYNKEREISSLEIVDSTGQTVYSYSLQQGAEKGGGQKNTTDTKRTQLQKELDRTGIAIETVLKRYGIKEISQMSEETYEKALSGLRKTKPVSKAA